MTNAGRALAATLCLLCASATFPSVLRAETVDDAATATPLADTSRLVIAGGAVTEIMYAIGAADKIVAVDSSSLYPPEALKTKANIGYFRALSTEGVLATRPSAIIASDKAGPPEVVRALRAASIPYVEIDDKAEPEALISRVRRVARLVGKAAEGETLAQSIKDGFAALEAKRKAIAAPKRAVFVLSLQNGRMTVAGRNSSADTMLRLAGSDNCAADLEGYKPISAEALIALNPDVIVVGNHGGPIARVADLMQVPGIETTTAGRTHSFVEIDSMALLGFGPRAPKAAGELMAALYPQLGTAGAAR